MQSPRACAAAREVRRRTQLNFLSVARIAAGENVRVKAVALKVGQHLQSGQLMGPRKGGGGGKHAL
jgi:hypothetical protein